MPGDSRVALTLTNCDGKSPKHRLNCDDSRSSCACRDTGKRRHRISQERPRILKSDARRVQKRVESHASQLKLRGARHGVLIAVLELLCGYKRISDDAVRLTQIAERISARGGRSYDLKTIGRALASLAIDELIVYTPAQGRGARALLAIHPQHAADIEVLPRDETGRVIVPRTVTFSEAHTSYRPKANYPPTPQDSRHADTETDSRPTRVKVQPAEVREILEHLPAAYQDLPLRMRWRLGGLIRQQLSRGWTPAQILAVLAAPLPAGLQSPLRLALWRFRKNMLGSGPRLAPLQQAWDQRAAAAARQSRDHSVDRWLAEVTAVTTCDEREQLLAAAALKFNKMPHPKAAVAAVARMAVRACPERPLIAALRLWLRDTLAERPATPLTELLDMDGFIAASCVIGRCVDCQSAPGHVRHELPTPTPVCDRCWQTAIDPATEDRAS